MIRLDDDRRALDDNQRPGQAVFEHGHRGTIAQVIVETLRILRNVRRERDVYREIAVCAIHRLHDQYARIGRQRVQIRRLHDDLRNLRERLIRRP